LKKPPASLIFLLWTGIIITIFYVVQKPDLSFPPRLAEIIQILLVAASILLNAYGIERRVLKFMKFLAT
jgi:hypothetical protein